MFSINVEKIIVLKIIENNYWNIFGKIIVYCDLNGTNKINGHVYAIKIC